jgi:hypothetical protein
MTLQSLHDVPAWTPPDPLSPESIHLMFVKYRVDIGIKLKPADEELWKKKLAYDQWVKNGGGRASDEEMGAI